MKIYEIGTGYTSIPAKISAATEIIVEQLTKAMLANGEDVQIIDIWDKNRKENKLPIDEVKIPAIFTDTDVQLGIMHKLKRVVYSLALANRLKRILKESNEKVVFHFHNQYNLFFFLKMLPKRLRKKCLIAYTNHSGIWRLEWKEIENIIKKRYFQEAECMKKADLVFVLNEETKNNAVMHLGADAEHFINIGNGVNTEVYHPLSDEEIFEIKNKYGLSGKKVFLQVGSVYENKGQKRVIEYLEPILEENPDLVYAYVGGIVSEEYKKEIDEYVVEKGLHNQVKYLGMVCPGDALNQLYNIAEITILASKYEGFSLVVIESMAAGTPVLIDRDSPFFVGKGNVLYTKKNFVEVVNSEVLNGEALLCHKQEARNNVVSNYAWKIISKRYVDSWNDKRR